MKYEKIDSIEDLDRNIEKDNLDYVILLKFGLRSSKHITYGENENYVMLNLSDDSEEEISKEEMKSYIKENKLYVELYE